MALALSGAVAVAPSTSPAFAKGWNDLRQAVAQVVPSPVPGFDDTPAPSPSAVPSALPVAATPLPASAAASAPARKRAPLLFSLTGNVVVGERAERMTQGDPLAGTFTTLSQSSQTNNAGLMARIERRSANSSFELSVPAGFAVHQTTLGELQAGYYTPRLGLVYGAQPLSFLGGVPVGTTTRGFSLVLPLRGGDLTFFEGPANGPYGITERVTGVRGRALYRRALVEFGADRARASDGSGYVDDLVGGFAQNAGLLSHSLEAALQRQSDGRGATAPAYAYQYRADYGSDAFYSTATVRRVSDGFMSLGSGFLPRTDFASAGIRASVFGSSLGVDENLERSGTGYSEVLNRRGNFSLAHSFARSNVSSLLNVFDQRSVSGYGTTWSGGAAAQVGLEVRGVSAILGANAQRSTDSFSPSSAIVGYSAGLQRQFGEYFASAGYQTTRQIGAQSGLQGSANLALTRSLGLTAFTFSQTVTHVISPVSNALQTTPQLTVTRRLSPALALALNYGEQRTSDRLNPSGNARTRIFGAQIAAPFAIGSGVVNGRVDPNLPATISGVVVDDADSTQFTNFASAMGNGVGNVAVVLDGGDVQRTDLSGRFQFNFVKPGVHQLRLETASLPRGVTADQPFATITVLGGQTGQTNFRLGTFGGVEGHIYGRDSSGQLYPISSIVMRLDDTLLSTTGPLGAYGFGRLTAGTHVVSIEPSSVIANVGFAETKKSIVVRNGEVSVLDFTAAPLGSISGKLVYDPSLAPGLTGPVLNAYVVAEPGEHAAITDDNGGFIIDDLPPGTYTVDVDGETLPDDTGSSTPPQTVTLSAGRVDGVQFVIGRKQKAVVFSLKAEETPLTMSLSRNRLPPGGTATVFVDAPQNARGVSAEAFGVQFPLAFDRSRKKWTGEISVPLAAHAGDAEITAEQTDKKSGAASAVLTVDPTLPLVAFDLSPRNPSRGQYVRVRARFLTSVAPNSVIKWTDGQITRLAKPVSGRVYEFTVKISVQPMRGQLLTRGGELPILLR